MELKTCMIKGEEEEKKKESWESRGKNID